MLNDPNIAMGAWHGELRLYEVWRSGNDDADGPDGQDTIFVVRARNHIHAAALADECLRDLPHKRVRGWSQTVYEIGISHPPNTSSEVEKVVLGPFIQFAYDNWNRFATWYRYEAQGPWIWQGDCPECGFDLSLRDAEPACPNCGGIAPVPRPADRRLA